MIHKSLVLPAELHREYLDWLDSPGLRVPAGKTCLEYFLETKRSLGQLSLDSFQNNLR